jgi:hypothetical protein
MVTVNVHVEGTSPTMVRKFSDLPAVVMDCTERGTATLFFRDKTHAQVWLNDALRQVNDIQEPKPKPVCAMPEGAPKMGHQYRHPVYGLGTVSDQDNGSEGGDDAEACVDMEFAEGPMLCVPQSAWPYWIEVVSIPSNDNIPVC